MASSLRRGFGAGLGVGGPRLAHGVLVVLIGVLGVAGNQATVDQDQKGQLLLDAAATGKADQVQV